MKQMSEAEMSKVRNRDREMAAMKQSLMMRGIQIVGGVPVHRPMPVTRKF